MSSLNLEIITPSKVSYTDTVDEVVVPGVDGQMGILPHHVPIFAKLAPGEIKIVKGSDEVFMAIGGGFIEVTLKKVIILVTRAVHADELNEEEIEKAKQEAEKILKEKPEDQAAVESAQAAFHRALLDLKVLRKRRRL